MKVLLERSISFYVSVAAVVFIATGGVLPGFSSPDVELIGSLWQAVFLSAMLGLVATRLGALRQAMGKMWLLLLVPVLAMASALWSQDPAASFRRGLFFEIVTVFAIYLAVRFPLRALMDILTAAALLAFTLSILVSLLLPAAGRDALNGGAWQGVFGSKNACAAAVLFFTTPLLAVPAYWRRNPLRKVFVAGEGLLLLVMSNSKMAFLVLGACALLAAGFELSRRFRPQDRRVLQFAGLAVVGVLAAAFYLLLPAFLGLLGKDLSFGSRVPIWNTAVAFIAQKKWLGYGYEAFWGVPGGQGDLAMRMIGFDIHNAQNGFLDVLLELGIAGLIPTLLVFLVAFRNIFMVQGREHRELQSWSLTVMVMLLIYETDESLLLHPYYLPWFLGMVLFSELQLARRPMTSAEDSLRRSLYAMELSSAG